MLPGFRFLFAAMMLSMSLLIFGLGATALLRAAHESFASNSSWRAAPEVSFVQHPDTTLPMLAALRVEPSAIETANAPANRAAAPADQESAESAGGEVVAASRPAETPPAEIAKPAELPPPLPLVENPPAPAAASVVAISPLGETTPGADEQKRTSVAAMDPAPAESEPAAVQAEPAIRPEANLTATTPTAALSTTPAAVASPGTSIAATKIATLGGPPVAIVDAASASAAKSERAKSDETAVKKRGHARRTLHRRRLVARARFLVQQQSQTDPFSQPQQAFPPAASRQ